MGSVLRVVAVLALALAVGLADLAAPAARAAAAAGAAGAAEPVVETPVPRPGSVVPAGAVDLRVRVSAPVTSARFRVDGAPVAAAVTAEGGGALLTGRAVIPPGTARLTVEAEGPDAALVARTWSITATDRVIRRHAGRGRLETAVAVSAAALPAGAGAPAAVLARADDFADALAGVPLAGAVDGPLLLTGRDALAPVVAAELQRVLLPGASVHLLGGTAALGADVEAAVARLGFRPVRHAGADRYATAAAIAEHLGTADAALLASGTDFPDALAASAVAARLGMPILLTGPGRLPAAARAALEGVGTVTIAGGTAAVGAGVEAQVRELGGAVRRVAGPERYATAAALAGAFPTGAGGVSLASGAAFPDALTGARHAASLGQPLLLTAAGALPAATREALATLEPTRVDVYGGAAAVMDATAVAALRAALDGPAAPRLTGTSPAVGQVVSGLAEVAVALDRPVDPATSSVYVELGGRELLGSLQEVGPSATLTYRLHADQLPAALHGPTAGRVVVRAVAADGAARHDEVPFAVDLDRVFARTGPVALHLPSRAVALVGYHQANHAGAQELVPAGVEPVPSTLLPSRDRRTGRRSAADVVASPSSPVLAPVSGRVVRAGSYLLYCRYADESVIIEPDDRPGWEVKVLHFTGRRVDVGDRVVAGQTVIGAGARAFPFASQVDRHTATGWPHLHVEVVDPSVPNPPGGGC